MSSKKKIIKSIAALTILTTLGACAARQEAHEKTNHAINKAERQMQVLEAIKDKPRSPNVRIKDEIWLGSTGIRSAHGEPLPSQFENKKGFSLVSAKPMSLVEISQAISEKTLIPVKDAASILAWQPDPQNSNAGQNPGAAFNQGGAMDSTNMGNTTVGFDLDQAAMQGGNQGGGENPFSQMSYNTGSGSYFENGTPEYPPMKINWEGKLSDLLDHVTNYYGIDWTYKGGVIRFIGPETRSYTLYALNTSSETEVAIDAAGIGGGSQGESGGASGSAKQSTSSKITNNYWTEFENTLQNILPYNASWSMNQNSGAITVTALPSIQRHVQDFIKDENERLGRQVAINVKVLSVSIDNSDNYNLDIAALFNDASGTALSIVSPTNTIDQASSLTLGILDSGNGTQSKWADSEGVFQALSKAGKVSLLTSANVTTLNNHTAPVSVVTQKGYLRSVDVSTTSDTTTTALEPGTVNSGFNMSITPRIFSNGEVMMNYSIMLSELINLEAFETNDVTIQIPEVDSRSFMQSVKMNSGDTLVLAGFEKDNSRVTDTGTGSPTFWFPGGGTNAENSREVIVILMTPVIVDNTEILHRAD